MTTGDLFHSAEFGVPEAQFNAAEIGLGRQRALDYWTRCAQDKKAAAALAEWAREVQVHVDAPSRYATFLKHSLGHEPYMSWDIPKTYQRPFRAALALLLSELDPAAWGDPLAVRILPANELRAALNDIVLDLDAPYYEEDDLAIFLEMLRRWIPARPEAQSIDERKPGRMWILLLSWIAQILLEARRGKTIKPERLGEIVRWLDARMRVLCARYPELLQSEKDLKKNFQVAVTQLGKLSADDPRALALGYCVSSYHRCGEEQAGRLFDLWVGAGLPPQKAQRLIELFWDLECATSNDPSQKWCKEVRELLALAAPDRSMSVLMEYGVALLESVLAGPMDDFSGFDFSPYLSTGVLTAMGLTGAEIDIDPLLPGLRKLAMGNAASVPGNLIRGLRLNGSRRSLVSLLKIKRSIKHKTVQKTAENAIAKACQDQGICPEEVVELSLNDHDLGRDGVREEPAGGHRLRLGLQPGGKAAVVALGADGKPCKTIPDSVKRDCADLLKELKADAKAIDAELGVLRDQLERSWFRQGRISPERFQAFYLGHPLGAWLARRLIWLDDQGRTFLGLASELPPDCQWLTLWHPLLTAPEVAAHWRRRVMMERILQPFKQAWRECYALEAAEQEAGDHSHRYAGYVLDSKRYHGLRKSRGWGGAYGGYMFDDNPERESTFEFPGSTMRACLHWELEGDGAPDERLADRAVESTTVLQHLRFERKAGREWKIAPLHEIDPVAFSEVMRDVDLFVAVAGLRRRAGWNLPENADQWVKARQWEAEELRRTASAMEVRRDLLRFYLAEAGLSDAVAFSGLVAQIKGKRGEFELDICSGAVCLLPERTPVETIAPKKLAADLFLPFEEDDEIVRERLAAILHLHRSGK